MSSTHKKRQALFVLTLVAFLFPCTSLASIRINEIMYDLEGADTGREWVEWYNDGSQSVDLSSYKLFENNTNHALQLSQGSAIIPAGGYAVIADDSSKFLADQPSFSGTLFTSSFSLSNTGETLGVRNGELVDEDSVTYSSDMGAAGDGKSLSRNGATFTTSTPTPGASNIAASSGDSPSTADTTSQTSQSVQTTNVVSLPQKKISVDADIPTTALVGGKVVMSAVAYGTEGKPLQNAHIEWNFGNGERGEGATVFTTYSYPGKYRVTATGVSGEYSANAYATIEVIPADITLRLETDGSISVLNETTSDIDVSFFLIRRGTGSFEFPKGTVILKGEGIQLSPRTSKLPVEGEATLFYPNGMEVVKGSLAFTRISAANLSTRVTQKTPSLSGPATIKREPTEEPRSPSVAEVFPAAAAYGGVEDPPKNSSIIPWLLVVIAVSIVGAGAFVVLRYHQGTPASPLSIKAKADTFEIIE